MARRKASAEPATSVLAETWFARQGWLPFAFQREVWAACARGASGLLHASTGSGKTYAVWFGALQRGEALAATPSSKTARPLGVLWLTPMRALAADTTRALQAPVSGLGRRAAEVRAAGADRPAGRLDRDGGLNKHGAQEGQR